MCAVTFFLIGLGWGGRQVQSPFALAASLKKAGLGRVRVGSTTTRIPSRLPVSTLTGPPMGDASPRLSATLLPHRQPGTPTALSPHRASMGRGGSPAADWGSPSPAAAVAAGHRPSLGRGSTATLEGRPPGPAAAVLEGRSQDDRTAAAPTPRRQSKGRGRPAEQEAWSPAASPAFPLSRVGSRPSAAPERDLRTEDGGMSDSNDSNDSDPSSDDSDPRPLAVGEPVAVRDDAPALAGEAGVLLNVYAVPQGRGEPAIALAEVRLSGGGVVAEDVPLHLLRRRKPSELAPTRVLRAGDAVVVLAPPGEAGDEEAGEFKGEIDGTVARLRRDPESGAGVVDVRDARTRELITGVPVSCVVALPSVSVLTARHRRRRAEEAAVREAATAERNRERALVMQAAAGFGCDVGKGALSASVRRAKAAGRREHWFEVTFTSPRLGLALGDVFEAGGAGRVAGSARRVRTGGVAVVRVDAGGPAQLLGVRQGDVVASVGPLRCVGTDGGGGAGGDLVLDHHEEVREAMMACPRPLKVCFARPLAEGEALRPGSKPPLGPAADPTQMCFDACVWDAELGFKVGLRHFTPAGAMMVARREALVVTSVDAAGRAMGVRVGQAVAGMNGVEWLSLEKRQLVRWASVAFAGACRNAARPLSLHMHRSADQVAAAVAEAEKMASLKQQGFRSKSHGEDDGALSKALGGKATRKGDEGDGCDDDNDDDDLTGPLGGHLFDVFLSSYKIGLGLANRAKAVSPAGSSDSWDEEHEGVAVTRVEPNSEAQLLGVRNRRRRGANGA